MPSRTRTRCPKGSRRSKSGKSCMKTKRKSKRTMRKRKTQVLSREEKKTLNVMKSLIKNNDYRIPPHMKKIFTGINVKKFADA